VNTNMKYKIIVRNLNGNILTFSVDELPVADETGLICFDDQRTGATQRFHISNCEIKEVKE